MDQFYVSIEELNQYYLKNNITDYPKRKCGYPNMNYKINKDRMDYLKQLKQQKFKKEQERRQKYKESACESYMKNENNECMICCENIENIAIMKCGHVFCLSCIVKHGRENNNCPCCREEFTTKPKKIEKMTNASLDYIVYNHMNARLNNRGQQFPPRDDEEHQHENRSLTVMEFVQHKVVEAQYYASTLPLYDDQTLPTRQLIVNQICTEIVNVSKDIGSQIVQWHNS